MVKSTWGTQHTSKRKGRALSLQSIEIIRLYRAGQRLIEISHALSIPYQRVTGVIHRAKKRGDVVAGRKQYTSEERMTLIMNNPAFRVGGLKKHITSGMTEEVYFGIVKRMTSGGFGSFAEYMVEAAIDAYYAEESCVKVAE